MKEVVLVTGAAGFIGSHLVERLLQLGYRVVGLDNFDDFYSPITKWNNIRAVKAAGDFQLEQGDIRDASLLARIFKDHGINVVAHLAARAGVRTSLEQPLLYQDINIGGTVNLLEASQAHRVKQFIFASSSSVYGLNTKTPFSEESNMNYPISPYAASKAAAELYCRTYSHLYNIPTVVLRLFTVYGPRQRPEMAIHRFVRMVDRGEEVTLFGDGSTMRDYTYVDDIIAGFEAALDHREEVFQIFNLGSGQAIELKYLLKLVEEGMGRRAKTKSLPTQPGEVPITFAKISKAKTLLGYQPKIGIQQGIQLFIQWYRGLNERESCSAS